MTEVPWFWPGFAVSVAAGLALGQRASRFLAARTVVGVLLVCAAGIVVAATLTPGREALEVGKVGLGSCDLTRLVPPGPTDLAVSETLLNVVLFMPLGTALGLVPRSRRKWLLVLGALASPVLIETLQMLVPVLDRACESADVVDNLTGLGLGLVAGTAAGRLLGIGPVSRGNSA